MSGPLGTHRTRAMMDPTSHSHLRRSVLLKWLPRDPLRANREERGRRSESEACLSRFTTNYFGKYLPRPSASAFRSDVLPFLPFVDVPSCETSEKLAN